ncbi:MAG TPA: hypothetical protein VLN49_03760, partial [Gemmatimonadaceae bacterium]|nr:hypothetical protein [Gemmatimonadaceae bacterium]
MSTRTFGLALLLLSPCAVAASAQRQATGEPTLILTGARVFTADARRPWVEAIAIRGDRIVAVGSSAEVTKLATPATRRIDVRGKVIVPGFNDAHAHLGCELSFVAPVVMDAGPTRDTPFALVADSIRAVV